MATRSVIISVSVLLKSSASTAHMDTLCAKCFSSAFASSLPSLFKRKGSIPSRLLQRRDVTTLQHQPQVLVQKRDFLKKFPFPPPLRGQDYLRYEFDKDRLAELRRKKSSEEEDSCKERYQAVDEVRFGMRILKFAQLEILRARLREISVDCVSKEELLRICEESVGKMDAEDTARLLDISGHIFIVGDRVFLPSVLEKAVQSVMPLLAKNKASITQPETKEIPDGLKEELIAMAEKKSKIDAQAEKIVRREMWGGLGALALTTMALMRLTFWDLSWDVMEPICFFLTQCSIMAGMLFYMKTASLPTMDGIFQVRFNARQKRLMQRHQFDMQRFRDLLRSSTV